MLWVEQSIVGVILLLLVGAAVKYRTRLLLLFTGDDTLHISCVESCWWLATCCGICTGEWTRSLTTCSFVPRRWRGTNLVQSSGQLMGLTTSAVEIKNLVVGDLPHKGRADFYLAVECAGNPEMATSVAERKDPKIIHFPEVFTLRLRWNSAETPVRVTVRKIRVVGFEDICRCYVDTADILDWASSDEPGKRCKRLQLTPCDGFKGSLTPPWVMMEFDQPTEFRDLEHLQENRTVRTAGPDGTYRDTSVAQFKQGYALVDPSGGPAHELPEESLAGLETLTWLFSLFGWCLTVVATLFVVSFLTFRSYIWTCWRQMKPLTIAHLHGEHFPINDYNLTKIVEECDREVKGTELSAGQTRCLPTEQAIIDFCKPRELGGHFPDVSPPQPRPHAFERLIRTYTGVTVKSIPCYWRACELRPEVAHLDLMMFTIVAVSPFAVCAFRSFARSCIRGRRDSIRSDNVWGSQDQSYYGKSARGAGRAY